MKWTRLPMAAAILLCASATADAQTVAGRWIIDFNRSIRNENGVVTEGDPARARMTLEQHGDSVTGTWALISPVEDPMPAPRGLRGTIANGEVHLVSDPFSARVRDESGEREIKVRATYVFRLDGDVLRGTQLTRPEGVEDGPPARPFLAKREGP